jgi:hypothetical protein
VNRPVSSSHTTKEFKMQNTRFSTGAFVFTRTRGLAPRDRTDLIPLATAHGFAPALVPAYPGDRVAITRAITQASTGLARRGFLLRPIKRTSSEVVFGIVRGQKDEAQVRLDHDFEATVAYAVPSKDMSESALLPVVFGDDGLRPTALAETGDKVLDLRDMADTSRRHS